MKIIPLHKTNTTIVYKNSLCSMATVWVLFFITLSVMLPVLLVSLLSPYSGIMESRVLYEQPRLNYKFQYIFVATLETSPEQPAAINSLVACSTFANFNARMSAYSEHCEGVKYWLEDLDYDTYTDRAHFELQLVDIPARIKSIELVLFFDAQLKHKCKLSPPAVLTQQQILPSDGRLQTGRISLKAELQLKQYVEFACPFPGRTTKTQFRHVLLDTNNSYADMAQYQMESLLAQVKANPAYFQLDLQQSFYTHEPPLAKHSGLRIELELNVLQVPARYHLSIWERLGQFWLYFASFFGISFYIMNRLKDVLFGRHIIRSYETIPWKKLY